MRFFLIRLPDKIHVCLLRVRLGGNREHVQIFLRVWDLGELEFKVNFRISPRDAEFAFLFTRKNIFTGFNIHQTLMNMHRAARFVLHRFCHKRGVNLMLKGGFTEGALKYKYLIGEI